MYHKLCIGCILWLRTAYGICTKPYETYRRIIMHGRVWEMAPTILLVALYFATAALVKTAAFRPFILTKQFIVLFGTAIITFFVVTSVLWIIATVFRGIGKYISFCIAWSYTLIPTSIWFFMTSILYVIIPPPRTTGILGIAFSIVFLVCSALLFFWKVMVGYLSLRFGMKLDLLRISVVISLAAPIIGVYSYGLYMLGIYKVPFL